MSSVIVLVTPAAVRTGRVEAMGKQKPTYAWQTSRTVQGLPKIRSGVAGLDKILAGGLPEGRTTKMIRQVS